MKLLGGILGVLLIAVILWEAFETIVLPRRVARRIRLTRALPLDLARVVGPGAARPERPFPRGVPERVRAAPLLVLLTFWAAGLILGFALLHWLVGSTVRIADGGSGFGTDLYISGTTFFTLGLGDVMPAWPRPPVLTVTESGLGFAFLALVIGYLPVLYQSFSRREMNISHARREGRIAADGGELLRRHPTATDPDGMRPVARPVGALVRRTAREPPLLSRAGLLPLAAQQSILARGPDDRPRRQRPRGGRLRWRFRRTRPSSPSRSRATPSSTLPRSSTRHRRRRPPTGFLPRRWPACATGSRARAFAFATCRRRPRARRHASDVRALCHLARPVPDADAARVAVRRAPAGQLADHGVGGESRATGGVGHPGRRRPSGSGGPGVASLPPCRLPLATRHRAPGVSGPWMLNAFPWGHDGIAVDRVKRLERDVRQFQVVCMLLRAGTAEATPGASGRQQRGRAQHVRRTAHDSRAGINHLPPPPPPAPPRK